MFNKLFSYFKPPMFDDPFETRKAKFLYFISLIIAFILSIYFLLDIFRLQTGNLAPIILGGQLVLIIGLLVAIHQGHIYRASLALCSMLWLLVIIFAWLRPITLAELFLDFIMLIIMVSLFLNSRFVFGFTLVSIGAVSIVFFFQTYNLLPPPLFNSSQPIEIWFRIISNFLIIALLLNENTNNLRKALSQSQEQAVILSDQNKDLRITQQKLSQTLTNLQQTQTQLVETEKMAALGNLVAGVAHEINTPVGIGVSMASMLADETEKITQIIQTGRIKIGRLKNYIQIANETSTLILNNLQRAANLVQSFKQVAVDQSSQQQRIFALKRYLQEILQSLHHELKQFNYQVTIEGDDRLQIYSYPGDFAQIVTNLVLNSCRHAYQPEDAPHITIGYHLTDQNRLIFIYQDDGRGIPSDILPHIFDPFFTTARQNGGTGLGLHIIYNLITQKLKGTIKCESNVGEGVKFIVNLPLSSQIQKPALFLEKLSPTGTDHVSHQS